MGSTPPQMTAPELKPDHDPPSRPPLGQLAVPLRAERARSHPSYGGRRRHLLVARDQTQVNAGRHSRPARMSSTSVGRPLSDEDAIALPSVLEGIFADIKPSTRKSISRESAALTSLCSLVSFRSEQ